MAQRHSTTRKVTVSLLAQLLQYADRTSLQRGVTRSQVLSDPLAEMAERERDALAAEGYRFYAGEAEEFAAASLSAFSKALT